MGPCTREFVITVWHIAWIVCIFILRLSERPFSGLVGEVASSPINFTPAIWHGWQQPIIGIFKFYQVRHPTPWPSGKILRVPIRTWGFHFDFFVSNIFWKRRCRCWWTCLQFPRGLDLRFCPESLGALVSCLRVFHIIQLWCNFGGVV